MAKKSRKVDISKDDRRRDRRHIIMVCLAAIVGGLTLTIAALAYKWHLSEQADRLRANGEPVSAAVSGFY